MERKSENLLRQYLRELYANPILDTSQEVALAQEMQVARESLADVMKRLPAECRVSILGDESDTEMELDWPFDKLEAFYQQLASHAETCSDPDILELAHEAKAHKHALETAREAFILGHLRLVVHVAKAYVKTGVPLLDLIQEGNTGLMRAVEKFDYWRGNKFCTYAYWWIKQAIQKYLTNRNRFIHVPVQQSDRRRRIARAVSELTQSLGRKPSPREIAAALKMPLLKVKEIMSIPRDPLSLEDLSNAKEGLDLMETLPDHSSRSPAQSAIEGELYELMDGILSTLDPREEEVIRMHYGIGRRRSYTLKEIGQHMDLSRERIRQIEVQAIKILQSILAPRHAGTLNEA